MVVAVQEGWYMSAGKHWAPRYGGTPTQWLLLEEQEDGIKQLEVLGEVVELARRSASAVSTALGRALVSYVV